MKTCLKMFLRRRRNLTRLKTWISNHGRGRLQIVLNDQVIISLTVGTCDVMIMSLFFCDV